MFGDIIGVMISEKERAKPMFSGVELGRISKRVKN